MSRLRLGLPTSLNRPSQSSLASRYTTRPVGRRCLQSSTVLCQNRAPRLGDNTNPHDGRIFHPNFFSSSIGTSHSLKGSTLPDIAPGILSKLVKSSPSLAVIPFFPTDIAWTSLPPISTISNIILNAPFGAYGSTIIVMTIVYRLCLTLPATIWQRRRIKRMEEVVMPLVKIRTDEIAKELVPVFRAQEGGRSREGYLRFMKELRKRTADAQYALHRQYKTHPTFTQWAPLCIHIPLLILFSVAIRTAIETPSSPLLTTGFLWIQSLGQSDVGLATIGAAITFTSARLVRYRGERNWIESERLLREKEKEKESSESGLQGERAQRVDVQNSRRVELPRRRPLHKKEPSIKPTDPNVLKRSITTSSTRLASSKTYKPVTTPVDPNRPVVKPAKPQDDTTLAVSEVSPAKKAVRTSIFISYMMTGGSMFFLLFASYVPSGLVLYWVTSNCFSFCQNIFFTFFDTFKRTRPAEKAEISLDFGKDKA